MVLADSFSQRNRSYTKVIDILAKILSVPSTLLVTFSMVAESLPITDFNEFLVALGGVLLMQILLVGFYYYALFIGLISLTIVPYLIAKRLLYLFKEQKNPHNYN